MCINDKLNISLDNIIAKLLIFKMIKRIFKSIGKVEN